MDLHQNGLEAGQSQEIEGYVVEQISSPYGTNCAFLSKSTKFGTDVNKYSTNIFR